MTKVFLVIAVVVTGFLGSGELHANEYNCTSDHCTTSMKIPKGETSIYIKCNGAPIPYTNTISDRTGSFECSTPNIGTCVEETNSSCTCHIKDTKESTAKIGVACNCQSATPGSSWHEYCFANGWTG